MGHDPQPRQLQSARLDSWKEIASFLHRDARTVRRWERERSLPVHRVPGGERSGVFAYVAELERWLHTAAPAPEIVSEIAAWDTVALAPPPLDEETTAASQPASISALHVVNTLETTFVAESACIGGFAADEAATGTGHAVLQSAALLSSAPSRPRPYLAATLLLLLTAAAGISAAVVRYRTSQPVKIVDHKPNPEAKDLYLRGRYFWNLRTEEGLNCAVDLFTQSIVNDPKYAAAYAGLADAYLLLRQYGHMPNSEAFPRALAAARQAIALDDTSPEAHRSLAFILRFWNWDMVAAEKEYRRAIDLNPSDSQSHHWYATALLSSGRNREALEQIDIARALEPQSVSVLADRGLVLSATDLRAGIAALRQVEQAEPAFVSTHRYLARAYLQTGDYSEFLAESTTAANLSHDSEAQRILARARKVLAARGPKPMMREMAVSLAPLADKESFPAYDTARFFVLAGETSEALRYLRLASDRRDPGFLNIDSDAAFVPLRSSPEYGTLISHRDAGSNPSSNRRQPIALLDAPPISR